MVEYQGKAAFGGIAIGKIVETGKTEAGSFSGSAV